MEAVSKHNVDLLVSDSHSTDKTREIILKLQKNNKRLFFLDVKKRGLGLGLSEGLNYLGRFNPDAAELKGRAEAIRSLKRILVSLRDDYDTQRVTAQRFSREDLEAVSGLVMSLNGVLETIRGARGL